MATIEELIVYSNSRNGLGIRVLGAKRAANRTGIYIREILDEGLAQRDGRLKVGDQILTINDEPCLGINREHAVNLLRSAAATNHVRLRVKHFFPPLSSTEYQKLLHDEKSTDEDNDEHERCRQASQNRNENEEYSDELRMRRSSRRHYRHRNEQKQQRQSASNLTFESSKIEQEHGENEPARGVDVSRDALQALVNSRFKLVDLVELMKKIYPNTIAKDQKRELQLIEQLSTSSHGKHESCQYQHSLNGAAPSRDLKYLRNSIPDDGRNRTVELMEGTFRSYLLDSIELRALAKGENTSDRRAIMNDTDPHLELSQADGRITLKDFERQSSALVGERINLLTPFYSLSNGSSHAKDVELAVELRNEIELCRSTIEELQRKITSCEKSQRLSKEVELEYEDLLKFLYGQLRQHKVNEISRSKQIRSSDQLIQKLFNYLSIYVDKPDDEHVLAQLKFEYEQQQKAFSNSNGASTASTNKYRQQF